MRTRWLLTLLVVLALSSILLTSLAISADRAYVATNSNGDPVDGVVGKDGDGGGSGGGGQGGTNPGDDDIWAKRAPWRQHEAAGETAEPQSPESAACFGDLGVTVGEVAAIEFRMVLGALVALFIVR